MLHTDDAFMDSVTAAVARIEETTDAEIVVVAASRSDDYRVVSLLAGGLAAWVGLVFVLFSPLHFSGTWMPLELPLLAALVAWLVDRSPALHRRLVPAARLETAVAQAAAAAFHDEAVHGTRHRTGVLVYVSALEDRVVVLPDGGIEARVPGGAWNALRWGAGPDPRAPGDLPHFIAGLEAAGRILAEHVPATGDNPNEIPDAPRVRR